MNCAITSIIKIISKINAKIGTDIDALLYFGFEEKFKDAGLLTIIDSEEFSLLWIKCYNKCHMRS